MKKFFSIKLLSSLFLKMNYTVLRTIFVIVSPCPSVCKASIVWQRLVLWYLLNWLNSQPVWNPKPFAKQDWVRSLSWSLPVAPRPLFAQWGGVGEFTHPTHPVALNSGWGRMQMGGWSESLMTLHQRRMKWCVPLPLFSLGICNLWGPGFESDSLQHQTGFLQRSSFSSSKHGGHPILHDKVVKID